MATKKKEEVIEETAPSVLDADFSGLPSNVTIHKDRWESDSGTNQLVADQLPSLND
jgi:hypothetical protein